MGLLPTAGIPDLAHALLPRSAPAASLQLLRRWLLLPPPPHVADAMQMACAELRAVQGPMPLCRPLAVGKLVKLLSARQVSLDTTRAATGIPP